MRKTILLLIFCPLFISCSKDIEDRLIGSWKLDRVWKRSGIGGKETVTTGYENYVLQFLNGDNAILYNGADSLKGYWHTNWTTVNAGTENSQTNKTLKISVANFQQNKWLEWEFDDFDFRSNKQRIRAEDQRLGKDRYYEFDKQ